MKKLNSPAGVEEEAQFPGGVDRSERADLLRWTRENYGDAFARSIVRSLLGAASETPQFDAIVLTSMRRERDAALDVLDSEKTGHGATVIVTDEVDVFHGETIILPTPDERADG